MADVRKGISNLSKDNFSATLTEVEPFLLNVAGSTFLKKSVRRIGVKAKTLGMEVPSGYAKEAKATEKRRAKQDAFIKAKIEEAASAAEEAAGAEEEAPADEEEAPAEE